MKHIHKNSAIFNPYIIGLYLGPLLVFLIYFFIVAPVFDLSKEIHIDNKANHVIGNINTYIIGYIVNIVQFVIAAIILVPYFAVKNVRFNKGTLLKSRTFKIFNKVLIRKEEPLKLNDIAGAFIKFKGEINDLQTIKDYNTLEEDDVLYFYNRNEILPMFFSEFEKFKLDNLFNEDTNPFLWRRTIKVYENGEVILTLIKNESVQFPKQKVRLLKNVDIREIKYLNSFFTRKLKSNVLNIFIQVLGGITMGLLFYSFVIAPNFDLNPSPSINYLIRKSDSSNFNPLGFYFQLMSVVFWFMVVSSLIRKNYNLILTHKVLIFNYKKIGLSSINKIITKERKDFSKPVGNIYIYGNDYKFFIPKITAWVNKESSFKLELMKFLKKGKIIKNTKHQKFTEYYKK